MQPDGGWADDSRTKERGRGTRAGQTCAGRSPGGRAPTESAGARGRPPPWQLKFHPRRGRQRKGWEPKKKKNGWRVGGGTPGQSSRSTTRGPWSSLYRWERPNLFHHGGVRGERGPVLNEPHTHSPGPPLLLRGGLERIALQLEVPSGGGLESSAGQVELPRRRKAVGR